MKPFVPLPPKPSSFPKAKPVPNSSRTPNKFALEAYLLCFDQAHDVFHHRFVSKAGKKRAALIMYLCEAAIGSLNRVCIPESVLKRFPREMFADKLGLPSQSGSAS